MRAVFGGSVAGTRKSDGQFLQTAGTADRNVQTPVSQHVRHINGDRIRFRDLAQFAWPEKTDAHLSHFIGVDARTCRRWLAGDNEPPAEALGIILAEIMRRFNQRD